MRSVASYRNQDLLEKGLQISVNQSSEGGHRADGAHERRAHHLRRAPGDLDEKPVEGTFGTDGGLHTRAPLSADRCHLDDTAVCINRHRRDHTAVREEYMVERTINVDQDLLAFAADPLERRHKPREIGGWKGPQKPIARPIRHRSHPNSVPLAYFQFRLGWRLF